MRGMLSGVSMRESEGGMKTIDQVLDDLRLAISKVGTQKEFAKKIGVSTPYLNDVLQGNRSPGDKVLNALGLAKIIVYVKRRPG